MSAQSQSAAQFQPQLGTDIIIRTTIITMVITPTVTTTPITRTTIIIGTAGTTGINAQFFSAAIGVAASGNVLV